MSLTTPRQGLPATFDLVTTFDVVHDAVDPKGLLRSIRKSLKDGGAYLCLDINCSPKLEGNAGPLGSLFYGCSVLYCMTTSLAHGGAGLGTCGLHEPKLRELGSEAGFTRVRKLPLETRSTICTSCGRSARLSEIRKPNGRSHVPFA
jgi:hypothetical protein